MKTIALFAVLLFSQAAFAESKGFIVKLKPRSAALSAQALARIGVQEKSRIPELNLVVSSTEPSLSRADTREMVEYVVPNFVRRAELYSNTLRRADSAFANPNDPEAGSLWGMQMINAHEAWKISTGSKDVIAAVSDTGAFQHGELEPNIYYNPGEMGKDAKGKDKSKNKIDDDGDGEIDNYRGWRFSGNGKGSNYTFDFHYHGTHVSGTVGALGGDKSGVTGVVWNTRLLEVPFLEGDGSGTDEDAIRSILYGANHGARVMNASWGGSDDSQAMRDAIEYAGQKGMLFVAAAGNDGDDTDKSPHYPSAIDSPYVISVAALHRSGDLAYFSNYGATSVDLGAPGEDVYSTFNPMCNCIDHVFYNYLSGTSMAAPHVTGAVALIASINPNLSPLEIKAILLSTVTPNAHLKGKTVSGGTLNVGEAAKLALKTLH